MGLGLGKLSSCLWAFSFSHTTFLLALLSMHIWERRGIPGLTHGGLDRRRGRGKGETYTLLPPSSKKGKEGEEEEGSYLGWEGT